MMLLMLLYLLLKEQCPGAYILLVASSASDVDVCCHIDVAAFKENMTNYSQDITEK